MLLALVFSSRRFRPVSAFCPVLLSRPQQQQQHLHYSTTALYSTKYDRLVSGIAEISLGASLCVLWSEYSVITTGCGPLDLSDFLERVCYQVDIVSGGIFLFSRIGFSRDVTTILQEDKPFGYALQDLTLIQVKWAERLAYVSVLGAVIALTSQVENGSQMDGLSGINIELCRSTRDFSKL